MVCLFVAGTVFAADSALMDRYLNAANEQYSAGNYAKAFSYINTVLNSYKNETTPENAQVIAETIYYSYLSQIKDSRNFSEFAQVKEKLIAFPFLSSDRINRMVKIIDAYATGNPAVSSSSGDGKNSLDLQRALETVKKETIDSNQKELLATQKNAYESALQQAKEATGTNNRLVVFSLLLLAGVCFIVFVIVILNLVVNLKNSKIQNDKFVETLKVVSQLARVPAGGSAGIESLPNLYGTHDEVRMIGSEVAETGLPPPPVTEAEKAALDALARKCREFGQQIDQATGRKNNSKNVAETVFKIATEMGIGQYESMLFFSVAMVYDIGFLEIDKNLLLADNLTDAQKFEIRNHVKQGLAQLSFVPEKYMTVFADGVLMHHENMDGSGYPEGLSGARIPYIARVLRVSESFVALISRRSYRDIYDKESAIEELKKKPGLYDPEIVEVLARLI